MLGQERPSRCLRIPYGPAVDSPTFTQSAVWEGSLMTTRQFRAYLIASVTLLSLTAAPALAKTNGFQPGTYKTSGAVVFSFTIKQGECRTVNGGPLKSGYCFSGYGDPLQAMNCPDGQGFQPDYDDYIVLPNNARIPPNGKLAVALYSYSSSDEIAGTTRFTIKIKPNGTARGSVKKDAFTTWGTPATCTTGVLRFTGKRISK